MVPTETTGTHIVRPVVSHTQDKFKRELRSRKQFRGLRIAMKSKPLYKAVHHALHHCCKMLYMYNVSRIMTLPALPQGRELPYPPAFLPAPHSDASSSEYHNLQQTLSARRAEVLWAILSTPSSLEQTHEYPTPQDTHGWYRLTLSQFLILQNIKRRELIRIHALQTKDLYACSRKPTLRYLWCSFHEQHDWL